MTEYEQIMRKVKEHGLDFNGKHILTFTDRENAFRLDGEFYFGRMFEGDGLLYLLREVEDTWEDNYKEPFLYRIVDKYRTYLPNSLGHYLVEFYVVE